MSTNTGLETILKDSLSRAGGPDCPPKLSQAMEHAVFPGGARVRPTLCLAVAKACGDPNPSLSLAAAAAIEFLHCASLVHDDLPCFDDADIRRGKPSVHRAFGEPLAVLTGDALIVLAFETLAYSPRVSGPQLSRLLRVIGQSVGGPSGIAAGQAWECEAEAPLDTYHRAKTGALFVCATLCGALTADSDPGPWRAVGELIGEAYQVADDLLDVAADAEEAGKPIGQDRLHNRPSAVGALGVAGAVSHLENLVDEAARAVPDVPGAEPLRGLVQHQSRRLVPRNLVCFTAWGPAEAALARRPT